MTLNTFKKAITISLMASSASVFAANFELTFATTTPVSSPWGHTLSNFKELVSEYTKGDVTINASFGGALGNDTQLLQKAQLGSSVQGAQSSGANLGSTVAAFKAFDVPYIFKDVDAGMGLFYQNGKFGGPVVDELQTLMAKKNLRLLYVMPFEFRGILTTNKEVLAPEDMQGLKIRVTPSVVERNMITELGAGATTLGISEVYTALQTGTVDGLAIPPVTAVAFALNEVAGSINLLNFQPHGSFMTMNARAWKKLPKALQAQVQKAADDAVANNKHLFAEAMAASLKAFADKGAKVIEPTVAQQQAFAAKIQASGAEIATKDFNGAEQKFFETVKNALAK